MVPTLQANAPAASTHAKLAFNADLAAITLALLLAALVRFGVLPHVGW